MTATGAYVLQLEPFDGEYTGSDTVTIRLYGEKMTPKDGFPIPTAGGEPKRCADLLKLLFAAHHDLFWSRIWDLAHDPEALAQYGIKAIYGNVIYSQLREGLIHVFKIGPTGHLYVEDVPAM